MSWLTRLGYEGFRNHSAKLSRTVQLSLSLNALPGTADMVGIHALVQNQAMNLLINTGSRATVFRTLLLPTVWTENSPTLLQSLSEWLMAMPYTVIKRWKAFDGIQPTIPTEISQVPVDQVLKLSEGNHLDTSCHRRAISYSGSAGAYWNPVSIS